MAVDHVSENQQLLCAYLGLALSGVGTGVLGIGYRVHLFQYGRRFCILLFARKLALVASILRTVPTIVISHTFCASPDTRISYRRCLLIQGNFGAV